MTQAAAGAAGQTHKERLEAELKKMNIRSEADLRDAIHKLPALNIGVMVDPIKTRRRKGGFY